MIGLQGSTLASTGQQLGSLPFAKPSSSSSVELSITSAKHQCRDLRTCRMASNVVSRFKVRLLPLYSAVSVHASTA